MFINIVKFVINRKNKMNKKYIDNSRIIEFFPLLDFDGLKMKGLFEGDKKITIKVNVSFF